MNANIYLKKEEAGWKEKDMWVFLRNYFHHCKNSKSLILISLNG